MWETTKRVFHISNSHHNLYYYLFGFAKFQNPKPNCKRNPLSNKTMRKISILLYIWRIMERGFAREGTIAAAGRYSTIFAVPGGVRNR